MKRIFLLFLSGMTALILILSACEKVVFPPEDTTVPDVISYASDIQPIWDSRCVSCHTSRDPVLSIGVSYDALIDGNYINTADPASSVLMTTLYGSHDSRGGTTLSEKNLIQGWITQGALDN